MSAESGYADRGEVEAFAAGLSQAFLACRELGHNWMPRTAAIVGGGGFERVLRCSRCHTERYQIISRYGAVITNRYTYNKGYASKGIGRIVGAGREALRLESILRALKRTEENNSGN